MKDGSLICFQFSRAQANGVTHLRGGKEELPSRITFRVKIVSCRVILLSHTVSSVSTIAIMVITTTNTVGEVIRLTLDPTSNLTSKMS